MPRFFAGSRGEYADRPLSIPWRGWWQVLKRVREEVVGDRLSIIAAGIAYYALFSVFPAIAMLIMIYGLVSDAETARQQLEAVRGILPEDARSEEHTSELQSLMRISYAVFCLKKKKHRNR